MILFHTSKVIVKSPDIQHSRNHLDFGRGFNLTTLKSQAEKYGERFLRRGEEAFLNVYKLDENLSDYTRIVFNSYDADWLDFITACRKGLSHQIYDIVEGGIADDQVFDTVDLYFSGIYTREQALDQLRYKSPNHQLCITNQRLLDEHLQFVESIKL